MNTLVSSPEIDNITRYLRAWSRQVVSDYEKNHKIYHIDGKKATGKHICGILRKKDIDLVILNSHGNSHMVLDCDGKIMIDETSVDLLKGKTIHALACSTAKELGPLAIQAGAKGYIGYDERFILLSRPNHISQPLTDDVAKLFLDPAFSAPRALLSGKSCTEAVSAAQDAYKRSIKQALNSDIQSDNDKCVSYLLWDLKHLKSCWFREGHIDKNKQE